MTKPFTPTCALLLALLAGCSDSAEVAKAIKQFQSQCVVPVRAELYVGTWNRSLTVICDENKEFK